MPSRDALSKCGGELGPWLCSSTWKAWIESSMRFSVVSTKTGKPTPSNYLHKQLDVTEEPDRFDPHENMDYIGCQCLPEPFHRAADRFPSSAWARTKDSTSASGRRN